ncbi:MAG: molecular chaperone TorD family protein [Slackia sp.]|nr:molecular chaperone TorD family protein [Slackia sp.]
MDDYADLIRVVGMADSCELFSAAFSFPDHAIACALSQGTFQGDVESCLCDAGVEKSLVWENEAWKRLLSLRGCDGAALLERMRRAYSFVYLTPGSPEVLLYEGAFRHRAANVSSIPSMFRSAATLDVERSMKEAGVAAVDERRFPCDSVEREFAFLSYLAGSQASCLRGGDIPESLRWKERFCSFARDHACLWLPSFFNETCLCEAADIYRDIAHFARLFVDGPLACACADETGQERGR